MVDIEQLTHIGGLDSAGRMVTISSGSMDQVIVSEEGHLIFASKAALIRVLAQLASEGASPVVAYCDDQKIIRVLTRADLDALATAAEPERLREALEAFIRAYANVDQLDHDHTEVKLFEAWLRGCAALGITMEPPERRPGVSPK
jgi:hypothetical protein